MQQRSARQAARRSVRLSRAIRSSAEPLESRLLLSTYTVTSLSDSGPGSLRDAIVNSSADTIQFSVNGIISLSSQLEIRRSLTINGPGAGLAGVSGRNATRVIQVDTGVTAEIDGVMITGGHAADGGAGGAAANGAAGANGGAVLNAGTLTLVNDTITRNTAGSGGAGGDATASASPGNGGKGGNGGAIYNTGTLTLRNDTITHNDAGSGQVGGAATSSSSTAGGNAGLGGSGGGIYNAGALAIDGGSISNNQAGSGGDGRSGTFSQNGSPTAAGGNGGGIFSSGTLLLQNAIVSNNVGGSSGFGGNGGGGSPPGAPGGNGTPGALGGSGGGIFSSGVLRLEGDLLFGNVGGTGGSGGGGGLQSSGGVGGNGGSGGAIYMIEPSSSVTLTINNTTITGNVGGIGGVGGSHGPSFMGIGGGSGNAGGAGGSGAGIYCDINLELVLTNDTIASNTPGPGGLGGSSESANFPPGPNGPLGQGTGIDVTSNASGGDTTLYNTIMPDAVAGTFDAHLAASQPPSSNNLIGTGGSGGLTNGTNGNIVGVTDPKLGLLANNGGPTQTMALLAGSPAIDHGSNALANAAGLTTDQRGFGRIYHRVIDIGAFEFGSALPGDLNHDGAVNFADLLALAQNYGASNATWEQGDLNGDGSVNFADLLILAQNYGNGTPTAAAGDALSLGRRRATVPQRTPPAALLP